MKLPAFQFYPGDWRKDTGVQSLSYEARGVWFEILCLMHESERRGVLTLNGKPMPEDALARLLGIPEVLLKQILTTLLNHGVSSIEPETGALMNRRMVRDEHLRLVRSNAGKQGGNPNLLKQNTTTHLKQIPTPSVSSSSSVSSSDNQSLDLGAPSGPTKSIHQLRAEGLFRRRMATPMSSSEVRAWRTARAVVEDTTEEDWQILEWWYGLPSAPYRKTDFAALLNNWHAEIEKARRNQQEPPKAEKNWNS